MKSIEEICQCFSFSLGFQSLPILQDGKINYAEFVVMMLID